MLSAPTSARVQILDQLEGLIATFPCPGVQAAQALLAELIAQPDNHAYQLRVVDARGELVQAWPPAPASHFEVTAQVKTPELYRRLKRKQALPDRPEGTPDIVSIPG